MVRLFGKTAFNLFCVWQLVETVAACLVRITDCFAGSSELLDELCKHGIIQKSLNLIANDGHRSLSRATYSVCFCYK